MCWISYIFFIIFKSNSNEKWDEIINKAELRLSSSEIQLSVGFVDDIVFLSNFACFDCGFGTCTYMYIKRASRNFVAICLGIPYNSGGISFRGISYMRNSVVRSSAENIIPSLKLSGNGIPSTMAKFCTAVRWKEFWLNQSL